jgi:hypothetical protein
MIQNMFMFIDSFLVGKNGNENLSFLVTKNVGNTINLTDLKTLGKCYNFFPFFWTEVIERTKNVCEIFEDNKCDNLRSQKLHIHIKIISNFLS